MKNVTSIQTIGSHLKEAIAEPLCEEQLRSGSKPGCLVVDRSPDHPSWKGFCFLQILLSVLLGSKDSNPGVRGFRSLDLGHALHV